jgi:ZIP family zinc transporter
LLASEIRVEKLLEWFNAALPGGILQGFVGGLIITAMNMFGALAVLFVKKVTDAFLPYAMGFAAGAMLCVISDEIIPETHRKGHERGATIGILIGVCIMLFLDVSLD